MLLLLRLNPNRRRVIHVTSGVLGLRPRPPLFVSPAYRAMSRLLPSPIPETAPPPPRLSHALEGHAVVGQLAHQVGRGPDQCHGSFEWARSRRP